MATVIDSLLIELGLDASGFDKSQKKAVDSLKKMEDQANKSSKQNQKGAKETAESFDKITESVMKIGVAAFGVAGLKSLITSVTQTNTQLNRQSNMLGINVNSLAAWGQAVKAMGGNAEDFAASMQNMEGGLTAFSLGLGGEEVFTGLTRLGVGLKNGKVDLLELSKALIKVKEEKGIQAALALSAPLIGADTFYLLTQSVDKTKELVEQQAKLNKITQEGAQQSAAFTEKTVTLETSMMGLKNSIMDQLYPALGALFDGTTKAVNGFVEGDKKLDGFLSQLTLIAGAALSLEGALASLKFFGITVGEGLSAAFSKVFGVASLILHSEGLNKGEDEEIAKIYNNNPGNVEYDDFAKKHGAPGMSGDSLTGKSGTPAPGMSGDSLTGKSGTPAPGMSGGSLTGKSGTPAPGMSGGSLTQRLHNPGGLKFADQPGATLGERGFAKFETEEAGIAAQNDLLNKKASQGMNTLRKLIYGSNGHLGWLGSPSGQDYKDAPSYLTDMVKRTGMNPDQVISNWDLVRRAQAGHEAGIANTTSVSTQINTLNVHTQATNPDGIAKDMNAAIQQRAVIDYGIVGNQ